MRYYRIVLWGYGGEASYIGLTKEQFDYWSAIRESEETDDGEYNVIEYMTDPDEYLDTNKIADEVDFLAWSRDGETYHSCWYEAPTEFAHQWGVGDDPRVSIQEVDSEEYSAKWIADVIDDEYASEIQDRLEEQGIEFIDYQMLTEFNSDKPVTEPDYVCQFWSAEKGTFFEGIIATDGEFDITKLKLITNEFPNGDDTVVQVMYDGKDVSNEGGDTNGKGYSVHFWSNV